jgi:hypothetical protein
MLRTPCVGAAGSGRQASPPTKAALILPAWVWSCAAVLLRGSIPSCFRAPVPPEARSGPFPARLAGGAAIWCRRPNARILARIRGILWGMRPWCALRGGQAGARPVSQPPAPACDAAAGDKGQDITLETVAIAVSRCQAPGRSEKSACVLILLRLLFRPLQKLERFCNPIFPATRGRLSPRSCTPHSLCNSAATSLRVRYAGSR